MNTQLYLLFVCSIEKNESKKLPRCWQEDLTEAARQQAEQLLKRLREEGLKQCQDTL